MLTDDLSNPVDYPDQFLHQPCYGHDHDGVLYTPMGVFQYRVPQYPSFPHPPLARLLSTETQLDIRQLDSKAHSPPLPKIISKTARPVTFDMNAHGEVRNIQHWTEAAQHLSNRPVPVGALFSLYTYSALTTHRPQ